MLCTSRGRYTCRHKNKSHEPSFSACLYFCSSQCSTIKFSCPAKCFQSVSQCNTTSKHSSHFFANAPRSLPKHKTKREKAEEKHPLENVTLKSGWWSNSVNESPKGKVLLALPALEESSAAPWALRQLCIQPCRGSSSPFTLHSSCQQQAGCASPGPWGQTDKSHKQREARTRSQLGGRRQGHLTRKETVKF